MRRPSHTRPGSWLGLCLLLSLILLPPSGPAAARSAFVLPYPHELESIPAGTYDVIGLEGTLTIEDWGPNLALPGAAITAGRLSPRVSGGLPAETRPSSPTISCL